MPEPPIVMQLEEFDPVPGPGTLTWLPVRHTLGIRAFGTNAYIAARAGDDVVEPHDELTGVGEDPAGAHEELYFVARGHATFTIDDREHDAPAGTYVFIPDPASRRHAIATQAGTTVLSFGGPATFTPSAWEWGFRAAPLLRSDPQRARAILDEGLEHEPESASLQYNLACLEALEGDREAALARLGRAIELEPRSTTWARADDDLESLRDDPRFTELTDRH
jgi:hypothetical protein